MSLAQLAHFQEISRTARRSVLGDLAALLKEWRRRAQERRELAELCDRCLRDIRITRADAGREIRKPFWMQ